jgi:hypothetical protein
MRAVTASSGRPSSSATMAAMYVRVPVPRSWVPQETMTLPSRSMRTSTWQPSRPPPPQVEIAKPIPTATSGMAAGGLLLFGCSAQPISAATRSSWR